MSESTSTTERSHGDHVQTILDHDGTRLFILPARLEKGRGEPTEAPARQSPNADRWQTRVFDVLVSAMALVLVLPLITVAALLVWRSSPGPIIYRQVRCGKNGKHFVIYKFRTMVDGADALLNRDSQQNTDFHQKWKLDDDPRVTWIGGWLRKTSIDELPQLWNVLRGDMSLVGPRPVRPGELETCYGEYASQVFSVRPGLTGLWQVAGRSDVSYETRVALDLEYLQKRTLWYDISLLLRTVPAVLLMRGAV